MFNHIVVPLDGSYRAATATRLAMKLARLWHSQLVLLHIADTPPVVRTAPPLEGDSDPRAFVSTQLRTMAKEIARTGIEVQVMLQQGTPAAAILRATITMHNPLLVMATHGHTGDATVPLGRVARAILARAEVPMLFVKTPQDAHGEAPTAIMAVTAVLDGSYNDALTAPVAASLANALTVPLELLSVIPDARFASLRSYCPPEEDYSFLLDDEFSEANQFQGARVRMYLKKLAGEHVTADTDVRIAVKLSVTYDPTDAIAAHWRERPMQLGVMAGRGRTGIWRFGRSATLARAFRNMPCALLVVRGDHCDDEARGNPLEGISARLVALRTMPLAGTYATGIVRVLSWRSAHTGTREGAAH